MAGHWLAAVDDLIFLTKIRETAKQVGVGITTASPPPSPDAVVTDQPKGILLELSARNHALEWVRALKANAATRSIPIVAFASHVESDLISAARLAGCNRVLARSAFTQQLPALLRDELATQQANTVPEQIGQPRE